MICRTCHFETDRMEAREWRAALDAAGLVRFVVALLTPSVTRSLPDAWRVRLTPDTAPPWIAARDAQGAVLLLRSKETGQPLGLMTLYESADDPDARQVYVGYLFAETAWGQGYASEALAGFVHWARGRASIARLTAGVERDNRASVRVLEKCGFVPVGEDPTSAMMKFDLSVQSLDTAKAKAPAVPTKLALLPGRFTVCRLDAAHPIPPWFRRGPLASATYTDDELSIIVPDAQVPQGVTAERGWRAFRVDGPLDFSLTGVIAAIAAPLAAAEVSIFTLSTYDTDYVLVRAESLDAARAALAGRFEWVE